MQEIIQSLINSQLQQFIIAHEYDDEKALVLKHKTIHGIPSSVIADQIVGRRKAKIKIPTFVTTSNIIYPPGINLEQCSSEATAIFKSNQVKGKVLADLTGGLGIDTFFMSKRFDSTHYIETNNKILEIAKHNHKQLGVSSIQYHNQTSESFLANTDLYFDLIYIDPSRRIIGNQKVFKLSDCEPNVVALQDTIFHKSNRLLVKNSPWLDIQQGLKELQFVKKVFIVSFENECKEVLFFAEKNFAGEPVMETINLFSNNPADSYSFYFSDERKTEIGFSKPETYLYEPNASILKAGAFKSIGHHFGLKKIHPSTHLYTSRNLIEFFPGRVFKIEGYVKPERSSVKLFFSENKANITTRNYPLSPDQIKKKTGLNDGGEKYLIGFSGEKEKYLACAHRIK